MIKKKIITRKITTKKITDLQEKLRMFAFNWYKNLLLVTNQVNKQINKSKEQFGPDSCKRIFEPTYKKALVICNSTYIIKMKNFN